jgi:Mrp family chromosome partitioning ATPase
VSRVADALSRARHAESSGVEADADRFGASEGDADGHPWNTSIPAPWEAPARPDRAPASPVLAVPEVVQDLPPLSVEPEVQQQLAGLVDRVFLSVSGASPHCVAFAFAGGAGSASFVTAVAAEQLAARTAAQVCALDIDFASPSLHQHFGAENGAGLAGFIRGDTPLTDVTRQVRGNLWTIPAGHADGAVQLASPAARQRLAELLGSFEYILVSAPPFQGSGSSTLWFVDGAVLLAAADSTRRDAARAMSDALQRAGTPVLGAVLTNRRYPIPASLYARL